MRYLHTMVRVTDLDASLDFYVNKLGMKKVGEMDLGSATNHFFALAADPSQPMLELTHNHDRTEAYDKGDGYAHVVEVAEGSDGDGPGRLLVLEAREVPGPGRSVIWIP